MAITYIKRINGSTNNFVFLWSSDSTLTCTASGYLTAQASNIAALNFSESSNPFQWFTNDIILLSASDGLSFCSIDSSFTTLSLIASGVVPLPASVSNALTAHAGGGQTNALALTSEINRITTVATAGDSVKLPTASPGLQIIVINNGANPMQVFGAGSDTINGVSATTGVSQIPNSIVMYVSAVAGLWQSESLGIGYSGQLPTFIYADSITAHSGGGQASATQLSAMINNVSTVAAAADSVKLPASAPGLRIVVINSGAHPCQVFGLGTDTINGIAAGTGVSQSTNAVCIYECVAAGAWFVNSNSLSVNIVGGQSGNAGFLQSFPPTAAKGSLKIVAVENTGDTVTTISNAAMGQASVISIPDPGAATANFNVSASALIVGNLIKSRTTDGALEDQGVAMKSVAQAAVAGGAAAQTVTDAFCTTGSCVIANWNDVTNACEIIKVAAGNGSFVVTSTVDPGASHLNYVIFK